MKAFAASRTRWRLTMARWRARVSRRPHRHRVLATVCWKFPIYSQTFVYEELVQLLGSDFDLTLLYSELDAREHLPEAFAALWERKQQSFLDPRVAVRDFDHYRRRMPAQVDALITRLCEASGCTRDELTGDPHFQMAFSYTRLAEAYRPDYLHSYFFYEGTLFTLVAAQLLGIPRGVSCYADHMLQDFPLKLVSLHLETCDVVVATSERIGRELLAMHPRPESGNVLVKPNAIDTARFPVQERSEPALGEPFQVVCVARLEPKKGLLDLVEAVRLVIDRGINLELHLIGSHDDSSDGSAYRAQLIDRIRHLQMENVVVLHGRCASEAVRGFLKRAHLFAAPFIELDTGDKDGIPTALLEAMSTGAAILTTNAGSITEPIQPGVNGVIVEQRNPAAMAEALSELLADPARRATLGYHAARSVRESYDVKCCDRKLHERIRLVLAARGSLRV